MPGDEPKQPRAASELDASATVSVDVDEIPDASEPQDELPALPADAERPATARSARAGSEAQSAASGSGTPAPASRAEVAPDGSGSVEIAVSSPELAPARSGAVEVKAPGPDLAPAGSGSVEVSPSGDSTPVMKSGAIPAVAAAGEGTGPARSRRITGLVQDAVSAGVEKLGTGIGTVGEGISKVGDLTKKVPLVGASVGKLGEGLTKAGESIHVLPRVAQTRRGRLLMRSVVVGFLLVFSWIAVIVAFQLRSHDTPDFRPVAERLLVQISQGRDAIGEVYERASPRFQEVVRKERFVDDMIDLDATNGTFREITAINETLVTRGPTGRVGRVGLTALYERGIARGSISFHYDRGQWKLLGIGIEVPRDVKITQPERDKRVAACLDDKGRDVSDIRSKCAVRDAAETILEQIRDGQAGEVWDRASDVFKQQDTRKRFIDIQNEHRAALGAYKRLLTITEARAIGGVSATFDMLAEFEQANGVRVDFGFARASKSEPWQLRRFKVVVPMPRADAPTSEHPDPEPAPEGPARPDRSVDPPLIDPPAPEQEIDAGS